MKVFPLHFLLATCFVLDAPCNAFMQPCVRCLAADRAKRPQTILLEKDDDEMDEEEASRRVMQRLMLPNLIGHAMTAVAWAIILGGVMLNLFGYSYVVDHGRVRIDTLEARQFQDAKVRMMREVPKR